MHPAVDIEVLGQKQKIPKGIGITDKFMRVIHTHDETGVLHVESPYPHQFYLKDFFTIWNRTFNSTCIFEYCADGDNTLEVFVNGAKSSDFDNIPLREHDKISIVYRKRS